MLLDRLPPANAEPQRRERPTPTPRDLGTWTFLAQTQDSSTFHLVKVKRGVNLFWVNTDINSDAMYASWHLQGILEVNRGLKTIEREGWLRKAYDVVKTTDPEERYVCQLPPGEYHVVPRINGPGNVLFWYDATFVDDRLAQPKLPPELRGWVQVRQRPLPAPVKSTPAKATLKDPIPRQHLGAGIQKASLRR